MKNIFEKMIYAVAAVVLVPVVVVAFLAVVAFLLVVAVILIPVIAVLAACGVPVRVVLNNNNRRSQYCGRVFTNRKVK